MTLDLINTLEGETFVSTLGGIYEHSPWVVEAVVAQRPFATTEDLIAAMRTAVDDADEAARVELIRAHPDLAGKLAICGELSEASTAEQAGLGLDRLSGDEFARFHELNTAYRERHGFPFVICARLTDKAGILDAFSRRTAADTADEVATAIAEIHRIARLRLLDLMGLG